MRVQEKEKKKEEEEEKKEKPKPQSLSGVEPDYSQLTTHQLNHEAIQTQYHLEDMRAGPSTGQQIMIV